MQITVRRVILALARFETRSSLVDDIDAALATDQLIITMTALQGFKRVLDLHFSTGIFRPKPGTNKKRASKARRKHVAGK
ncbi:hypothetical protein C7476_110162 [Phyllobacterium bourgognense]|uniref:Uncharacterized protein n=1 Tax=Phyllobacterium bourgognense TaxID=314236 RepID=A0A368YPY5_9HYPH|nr:hypothetical protein C7476_110162 [Phyllobacterium bourgognense]